MGGIDSFETIFLCVCVCVNPWPTGFAIFMNVTELLIEDANVTAVPKHANQVANLHVSCDIKDKNNLLST